MNLIEAIKTGKPFKRPEDVHWFDEIDDDYDNNWGTTILHATEKSCPEDDDCDICFDGSDRLSAKDILREDWEVRNEPT